MRDVGRLRNVYRNPHRSGFSFSADRFLQAIEAESSRTSGIALRSAKRSAERRRPRRSRHPRRRVRLGARRCAGRNHMYIPRRVEHEITRNETTHPPRIISRKRLIKVHGSARCARTKPDPALAHGRARIDPHTRASRNRDTRSLPSRVAFQPRPLGFLSPWSPALSSSRGDERARMLCNFDNQSHERRLIFIMITAASTSRMGTRSPIGGGRGRIPLEETLGTKELHRCPRRDEEGGGEGDSTIGLDRCNSRIDEPSASRSYLSIRVQRGGGGEHSPGCQRTEVPNGNPV